MGHYKDRRNFKPHNFNSTTMTVNGEHKVEGLEALEVELDDEETTVQKAADGVGIFVDNPSRSGMIRATILEASASNDVFWALRKGKTSFKISVLDSVAPNLNCRGSYCRVNKAPVVKRGLETDLVEWVFVVVYLDVEGGSYALQAA